MTAPSPARTDPHTVDKEDESDRSDASREIVAEMPAEQRCKKHARAAQANPFDLYRTQEEPKSDHRKQRNQWISKNNVQSFHPSAVSRAGGHSTSSNP